MRFRSRLGEQKKRTSESSFLPSYVRGKKHAGKLWGTFDLRVGGGNWVVRDQREKKMKKRSKEVETRKMRVGTRRNE